MEQKIKFIPLDLLGAYLIQPKPFEDHRGKFARLFCENEFSQIGHQGTFVQINYSLTKLSGAIRGLHFQHPPKAEVKVVRCIKGKVWDIIVDVREGSPTFLKWHAEVLSAENMHSYYIPKGFAHGFQALDKECELIYFHTEFYSPENEGAIYFKDPKLDIKWPLPPTDISNRDKQHPLLNSDFTGIKC